MLFRSATFEGQDQKDSNSGQVVELAHGSAVALSVSADRCSRHRVVLVVLVEVAGDKAIPISQLR